MVRKFLGKGGTRWKRECNKTKEAGTKVLASQLFFGLSSKTQWLSGLYYVDFISLYSPTQLCGGGTTKSNSNELPISVPLSLYLIKVVTIKLKFKIVKTIATR